MEVGGPLAVAAIILIAINLRPGIVAVGPVLPTIISQFGLSHATASLLTAIPDVLMGILALPTPWLARRFGRDPVLLLALLLLCLSTMARSFASNTLALLVSTAGVGAGIAISGTLIAGFIKARFSTRAAMLMGIYATALSFGSTVSAAVSGPIASNSSNGWRVATGFWSLVCIVAILGWLAVMLSKRKHRATIAVLSPPHRLPLGNPTAWLVALFFAFQSFVFYGLLAWISPMYREAGLSTTASGLLLASYTLGFMTGNPVLGWLSKSEDRRVWLASCSVLMLLGLIPIAVSPAFAPFIFVPICAFGLGGAFTLAMTLPLDNAESVGEADVWNAFVLTVGYLVAAGGPLAIGALRDLNGDFQPSIWLLVMAAAVMLAVTPFLQPHRRKLAA